MKLLHAFVFSFLLAFGAKAFEPPVAQKQKAVIGFEENSARLTAEARSELRLFLSRAEGLIAEKIDIVASCDPSETSFHILKLSRDRTKEVYNVLTSEIPDYGDYELRYFDSAPSEASDLRQSDCVIVTAYFLLPEVPRLDDPRRALFPEEFTGSVEMPASLAKSARPSDQRKRKSSTEGAERFTMENIHFQGNSALYTSDSEETLNEVLAFLIAHPSYKAHLIGHVNGTMGRSYLKKAAKTNPERKAYKNAEHLSLARAESIRDFLVTNGVDERRITCEGRGGRDKVYRKPKNERQNAANRRIEIILTR